MRPFLPGGLDFFLWIAGLYRPVVGRLRGLLLRSLIGLLLGLCLSPLGRSLLLLLFLGACFFLPGRYLSYGWYYGFGGCAHCGLHWIDLRGGKWWAFSMGLRGAGAASGAPTGRTAKATAKQTAVEFMGRLGLGFFLRLW